MFQYLLRRLFIMIPTLLGISLVTLLLVHLAPGDPVQMQLEGAIGKGTISAEEIEALRRTYYLHLPVLFNPAPEDGAVVNRKLMEDLSQNDENRRERAVRRLSARGAVALRPAVASLATANPESRRSILAGLEPVAERMGLKEALAGASNPVSFWQEQVQALPDGCGEGATQAVEAMLKNPTGETREAVRRLDTLALPALHRALQATPPGAPEAFVLTEELSRVAGVDLVLNDSDPPEARARTIDDWRRWWAPRRAEYTLLEGPARLGAIFTETQYAKWLKRLFTLDFDRSSRDNLPIRQKLGERLKVTLTLALLSLMVSYFIAIPLGVYSAVRQYSKVDRTLTVLLFMLYSLPSFWVAMLLQQYLCGVDVNGLNLFPLVGLTSIEFANMSFPEQVKDITWHLVLPIGVLTYRSLASLSRFQRVGMLDVIRQDYIRTARAKGLPERVVVLKHALRNSILPIVTLIGMHLPSLVGGAVIVESIFQINGMGLETLEAIRTRDMNWIMASVTLTAVMTMGGILLSDLLYAVVDPRIQVGGSNT